MVHHGASRGFGALITGEALAAGDAVVATARNPAAVTDRFGQHPNLLAVALDVTDEAHAHAAAAAAVERFGRIDILLSNAGYGLLGAVEEASAAEIEAVYRTNVFGLLNVVRAVLPHMRRQRSGHIMNVSSIGGYKGYVGWGVYGSTKFAVEGLTESLAQEVAPLGIKATIVEPGFFRTDFLDSQSLIVSAAIIDDYAATSGAMRELATGLNHAQPGDPAKLAKAMIELSRSPNPPLRMPFGSDTVQVIETENAAVADELARWRHLSVTTDFAEAASAA